MTFFKGSKTVKCTIET